MAPTYKPRAFRIYRLVTKTRILTVEDALKLGKIAFSLTEYQKGKGAAVSVTHYMDHQRAALLSHDLLQPQTDTPQWWNGETEYKGTLKSPEIEARTMTLELAQGTDNPIRMTITNGPGEPAGTTGAIKPKAGTPQKKVTSLLSWTHTRAMALAILMHLQAWQTMTYYSRIQEATWQPPDNGGPPTVDPETGEVLENQP
jgi:hypothetical protein